jgi:hypothetical protein
MEGVTQLLKGRCRSEDAGQKLPNVTTNNKNIHFNITVSTFPNCD